MKKISLVDLLLVVIIAVLILFFIWRLFGSSPTLDQLALMLSIFFLILALESRRDSKEIINSQNTLILKTRRLDDIYNILKSIDKKVGKRK